MHDDDLPDEAEELLAGLGAGPAPEESAAEMLDNFLGDDADSVGGPPAPHYRIDDPQPQPVNQATMVCLRGPCCHLWQMTSRFGADIDDKVRPHRHRVCIRNRAAETQLADANIYACEQWWPAWLSFVPESLRAGLRRPLRDLWERALRAKGYDFKWRWFALDVFESDKPGQREHGGPGFSPATFLHGPREVKTGSVQVPKAR